VPLRHDRDVAGERGPGRGRDPARRERRDDIPRTTASTNRASSTTATSGPHRRGPPKRPAEMFDHRRPLEQRDSDDLARFQPFDLRGNLEVPVRVGH
jgi:hypothetical protein